MTYEARVVTERIDAAPDAVYEFARTMKNLPQWASGLAAGVTEENGRWFTESPMGRVEVSLAPRNDYRVLDHDVILPDGRSVHNALRVTPAGDGSIVAFVVLHLPDVSSEAFEKDCGTVAKDLGTLKQILEQPPHRAPR